jgi:hypothetical protein
VNIDENKDVSDAVLARGIPMIIFAKELNDRGRVVDIERIFGLNTEKLKEGLGRLQ